MSKTAAMTLGLVLIFFGAQLFLVKSWLLNPTATRIFNENFAESNNGGVLPGNNNSGGLFGNGGLFGSGNTASGVANSTPRSGNPGQSWPYYQTDNASYSSGNGIFSNGSYQRTTSPGLISDPAVGRMDTTGRQLFVPPRWFMWPVLFLGAIFFLYGVSLR